MTAEELKYQLVMDRAVFGNRYIDYVSGLRHPDLESVICVEIPAYCDPELPKTMESLKNNAVSPNRVRFAVCYQGDDRELLESLLERDDCDVKYFTKEEAPGLCAARYECNIMHGDARYVMHIDSHMRAAKYWDVALIAMLEDCRKNSRKPILSGYPRDYSEYVNEDPVSDVFTDKVENDTTPVGIVSNIKYDGTVRFRGLNRHGVDDHIKGMFISGGFVFADARLDDDCPSDPFMFFVADEISMDVRYYTHGYDVWHPRFMPIWHFYGRISGDKPAERFNSSAKDHQEKQNREHKRLRQLFGLIPADVDFGDFGLGAERTIESFCEVSGLDLEHHMVATRGKEGTFFEESHDRGMYVYEMSEKAASEREHFFVKKEMTPDTSATICVQIPSYKDSQILQTIKSLLYQADNPKRVHFAVCLQDDDEHIIEYLESMNNVRVSVVDPKDAQGTGAARLACQNMYDGEDYVLITDAHMLAIRHWDSMLIRQLDSLYDPQAVISGQAPDFGLCRDKRFWHGCFDMPYPMVSFGIDSFTDSQTDVPSLLYNNGYNGVLAAKWKQSEDFDVYVKSFGITGCYTFTYGEFNDRIPFSRLAVYRGDECMTSLVAYTNGFNVYTFRNAYLLHDAKTLRKPKDTESYIQRLKLEQKAIHDLVMKGYTEDIHLGSVRTLDDLTAYLGVDFRKHVIYKRAYEVEPGRNIDTVESVGNRELDRYRKAVAGRKIYVIVAFDHSDDSSQPYTEFVSSMKGNAVRPENIVVCSFKLVDGNTYTSHINQIFDQSAPGRDDIILFVDGYVRFLRGWDDMLVRDMTDMGENFVFSTQTYTDPDRKKPYQNPAVKVIYDFKAGRITAKPEGYSDVRIKPVVLRGVMAMTAVTYRKCPFDPNLCYDDHVETYALRLFTHGIDVYHPAFSHLYRTKIPVHLDGIEESNEHIVRCLSGSIHECNDMSWLNYPYGHGHERSIVSLYHLMGFVDTNRHSNGSMIF